MTQRQIFLECGVITQVPLRLMTWCDICDKDASFDYGEVLLEVRGASKKFKKAEWKLYREGFSKTF